MSNSILDYFRYLRDASKNIVTSGDMYRCLIPKYTKKIKLESCDIKENISVLDIINKNSPGFSVVKNFISQDSRGIPIKLYLGVGVLFGFNNKRICGSIINIPIEITDDDVLQNGGYKYEIIFEEATLNYDLIASILPDYFTYEMNDESHYILNAINKIEESFVGKNINNFKIEIENLFSNFEKINPNFKIEKYTKPIEFKELIDVKNKKSLIYSNKLSYSNDIITVFSSEKPNKISVWNNLKTFCEEIENKKFSSPSLKSFLGNVFGVSNNEENEANTNYENFIKGFVPIDLSANQIRAINNAFNSRVSYIQGPPGTGKSHTIAAILLAAIMLDKKVLVVSQKKHAIDVVSNKIIDYFSKDIDVPFIVFDADQKTVLKNNLAMLANKHLIQEEGDEINKILKIKEEELKKEIKLLEEKRKILNKVVSAYQLFFIKNEDVSKKIKNMKNNSLFKKYLHGIKDTSTINEDFLNKITLIENKYFSEEYITNYDRLVLKKLELKFKNFFNINISFIDLLKNKMLRSFLSNWFKMMLDIGEIKNLSKKSPNSSFIQELEFSMAELSEELLLKKKILLNMFHKKKINDGLMNKEINQEVQKFSKMLHWNKADKIIEKMKDLKYEKLFEIFPIWLSEIKNIGELLPNRQEMFDLVIVDESSQVNLAEILPVFYRAKKICIVGDHKQLGLNASGLTFSLSKKFDKMVWNKYKTGGLSFDEALEKNLVITKSSILDLLRSEENKNTFTYVMLDEHYRSLPGLMGFNNKYFYENEIKVMTETPEKVLLQCFSPIKVVGKKDGKINKEEAITAVNAVKFLINKKLTKELKDKFSEEIKINKFVPNKPTIGIISASRDQVEYMKELLQEEFVEEDFFLHRIACGTPEEMQGDEFDIVVISSVTDENSRNNGHYSSENRFNVASSRSRYYTIFIYSEVEKIPMYNSYLKHFGVHGGRQKDLTNILNWDCEKIKNAHKLKIEIDTLLRGILSEYIDVNMFTNISSAGQMIDVAIFDNKNQKYFSVETISISEDYKTNIEYINEFNKRREILNKLNWKFINIMYHQFVDYEGNIDRENLESTIRDEVKKILTN